MRRLRSELPVSPLYNRKHLLLVLLVNTDINLLEKIFPIINQRKNIEHFYHKTDKVYIMPGNGAEKTFWSG